MLIAPENNYFLQLEAEMFELLLLITIVLIVLSQLLPETD